jgi:hypothetical protein
MIYRRGVPSLALATSAVDFEDRRKNCTDEQCGKRLRARRRHDHTEGVMAEQRRIPEIERLEARDTPSAPAMPYPPPALHFAAAHTVPAPQIVVVAPSAPATTNDADVTRDLLTHGTGGENAHPMAAVWQQAVDVGFASLAAPIAAEWPQLQAPRLDSVASAATAPPQPAHQAADSLDDSAAASPHQAAPTIEGVQRYAWKSVNRHRLDDPSDAVQQICLEWLLLAATVATTYDDIRRIVARVIDRAYTRLARQQRTLEIIDVPVRADATELALRDMQLDRDLGVKDLTDREWQVVGLRRQGYTFAEIGEQVGLAKQRAREMFELAISYLRKRYCD